MRHKAVVGHGQGKETAEIFGKIASRAQQSWSEQIHSKEQRCTSFSQNYVPSPRVYLQERVSTQPSNHLIIAAFFVFLQSTNDSAEQPFWADANDYPTHGEGEYKVFSCICSSANRK